MPLDLPSVRFCVVAILTLARFAVGEVSKESSTVSKDGFFLFWKSLLGTTSDFSPPDLVFASSTTVRFSTIKI